MMPKVKCFGVANLSAHPPKSECCKITVKKSFFSNKRASDVARASMYENSNIRKLIHNAGVKTELTDTRLVVNVTCIVVVVV